MRGLSTQVWRLFLASLEAFRFFSHAVSADGCSVLQDTLQMRWSWPSRSRWDQSVADARTSHSPMACPCVPLCLITPLLGICLCKIFWTLGNCTRSFTSVVILIFVESFSKFMWSISRTTALTLFFYSLQKFICRCSSVVCSGLLHQQALNLANVMKSNNPWRSDIRLCSNGWFL